MRNGKVTWQIIVLEILKWRKLLKLVHGVQCVLQELDVARLIWSSGFIFPGNQIQDARSSFTIVCNVLFTKQFSTERVVVFHKDLELGVALENVDAVVKLCVHQLFRPMCHFVENTVRIRLLSVKYLFIENFFAQRLERLLKILLGYYVICELSTSSSWTELYSYPCLKRYFLIDAMTLFFAASIWSLWNVFFIKNEH